MTEMLWASMIPGVFKQIGFSIDEAANRSRKTETEKRLAYYHDDQLDYILAAIEAKFSNPDQLTPCFVNIVKKVVNNLAMVYGRDAIRSVENLNDAKAAEKDQSIFQEISQSSALPIKLKQASRYVKILKTVLLRPVWRRGMMDLDVLTGDVLDVATGDTPEDLKVVSITHFPESGKAEEIEFSVWDQSKVRRLNYQGYEIKAEANPYGVLPFVPVFDFCPTNSFWLPGGDDLIMVQDAINEKLTDLLYVCRMQGFGVGWIKKGQSAGGSITIDPGTMIELPADGEIGYEAQKAPIKDIIAAIDFLILQAALTNGLSASSLSTKVTRESGVAKTAGNRELEELRRDDIALFTKYERQLFDLFRVIWNRHNPGNKIHPESRLRVDFHDPKPATSPREEAETWEILIDLKVASPVDAIMERNPDLKTREDALKFLETVAAENKRLAPAAAASPTVPTVKE